MNEENLDKITQNQQIPFNVGGKILSTTMTKQIVIYLVSFCLPPFGLGWAFKYIRSDGEKAKKIGWIAVILTIVSLLITFWVSKAFMDKITQSINSQMKLEDFGGLY